MKKSIEIKTIMIVSLVVGVIGYSYIMIFKEPGVLEIFALIFFTLIIRVSSGCVFDKDCYKFTILDYIKEEINGFSKILKLLYLIAITLLLFFYINRK